MPEVLCSEFKAKETTMKFHEKWVKLLGCGPCVALIGSLLIGSPQGFAQNAESSPSQPLRLTVAPQTSSRIAMKTLPKAVCVLHAEGDTESSRSLKMFSDDDGMIRFNVNPSDEADEVAAYAVDCTSDAQSRTFGLELRPNHSTTLEMPAPTAEIRTPKASDVIRPALTKAEALQLSDEELAKREYPMRPNPKQAPDAFANWLRVVAHPARRVDSRQVAYPELRASSTFETSPSWSGFALKNAPNEVPVPTYDMVEGEWNVPLLPNSVLDTTAYSVFWVGLDGDNGICPRYCPGGGKYSDLWQAGTGQEITSSIAFYWKGHPVYFTFSYYFAWTELVPQQSLQVLPNFNVAPGDDMEVLVWVGSQEAPSLPGPTAWTFVADVTQEENTYVGIGLGQENVLGYQAEWIMERPYENNALPDLADYGNTIMYYPYATQTNGDWVRYDQANNLQIFMYDDVQNLLSAAFPDDGWISYVWYNFQ
jgi:hypothetical protein